MFDNYHNDYKKQSKDEIIIEMTSMIKKLMKEHENLSLEQIKSKMISKNQSYKSDFTFNMYLNSIYNAELKKIRNNYMIGKRNV